MRSKIKWYLKQIMFLHYSSNYDNKVVVWDMWLGKCYNVKTFEVR